MHEVKSHMTENVAYVRSNSKKLLEAIIQAGHIDGINNISDMHPNQLKVPEGGESSAVFLLTRPRIHAQEDTTQRQSMVDSTERYGTPLIIKFRHFGILAEAEALNAWQSIGVPTPNVIASGPVPNDPHQTNFIILEAVQTTEGKLAPIGTDYFFRSEQNQQTLGAKMGETLAKIHTARPEKPFGSFTTDDDDFRSVTWAGYLINLIEYHNEFLKSLSVSDQKIKKLIQQIEQTEFPDIGSYIHDDYGPHAALIKSEDPLEYVIFDPNPKIADPYYDLANKQFQLDFNQKNYDLHPDKKTEEKLAGSKRYDGSLLEGYQKATEKPLKSQRLLANEIVFAIGMMIYQFRKNDHTYNATATAVLHQLLDRFL